MASSALIRDFARHARDLPDVEPDVIDTLVDFKESYFDDPDPARWRVDMLRELLLDILPRKVTAPDDWFAAVVPTTTAYLGFLRDGQRLAPGSDPATVLLAAVERIGGGVQAASRDPRNFGMAILSSVGGLAPSAADPGRALMDTFNALPDAERAAILDPSLRGGLGLPPWLVPHPGDDDSWDEDSGDDREWPDLPLTWLPPVTELASEGRSAPLVAALTRLVTWNGARHKVTQQSSRCPTPGRPVPPSGSPCPRAPSRPPTTSPRCSGCGLWPSTPNCSRSTAARPSPDPPPSRSPTRAATRRR